MNKRIEETRSQIGEWINASESIRHNYGLEKALGYVVGEKLYHFIRCKDMIVDSIDPASYSMLLSEFAEMIRNSFAQQELMDYFKATPRFGPLGHVASDEEHMFLAEAGAVEHSIDTETRDAVVQGQMEKLLTKS